MAIIIDSPSGLLGFVSRGTTSQVEYHVVNIKSSRLRRLSGLFIKKYTRSSRSPSRSEAVVMQDPDTESNVYVHPGTPTPDDGRPQGPTKYICSP